MPRPSDIVQSRTRALTRLILAEVLVLIICTLSASTAVSGDLAYVIQSCENKLNFDSVNDYRRFVDLYNALSDDMELKKVPKRCIKDRLAILELAELLSTDEICDPEKIDSLIAYHKRHFKLNSLFPSFKAVTHSFFEKYAIQVAHICKKNLDANIKFAKEELKNLRKTFEEAKDKVYEAEPSIKSNMRILMEQPDSHPSSNVKPRDQFELALDEYRDALTKLTRVEDVLVFDPEDCKSSKSRETKILANKLQTFFKPASMCHQLRRYYAGSILSIAKLANHGYVAYDEALDVELADNSAIRDWILAVQVCEPIVHMATKEIVGNFAIIDTCSDGFSAIEPMVYADEFQELDMKTLEEMIPKSKATRRNAQKIMRSAFKKMAKANLLEQVRSGVNKKSIFMNAVSMLTGSKASSQPSEYSYESSIIEVDEDNPIPLDSDQNIHKELSDEKSFELLMKVVDHKDSSAVCENKENALDTPVSMIDPATLVASSLTVMAIMLGFEWLFFIVMTLAAKMCHKLHFELDNILTFPPKIVSWSDADFARFNDKIEEMDEDDFFDYDELTPDEKVQRTLLKKVFGKPPPMLFKD